jgi:copper transport protein
VQQDEVPIFRGRDPEAVHVIQTGAVRPRNRTNRRPLVLTAAIVTLVTFCLGVGTASAHAALVEMQPGADRTVDAAPTEVRLIFNEGVTITPDAVRVFDPAARQLDGIVAEDAGAVVTAELPQLTANGSYTVAWHVVSADGHPIRGAYLFHLREATLSEPVDAAATAGSDPADVFRALGAVLALAGLTVSLLALSLGRRGAGTPRWWSLRWVPVVAGATLLLGGSVVAVGSSLAASFEVVLDTASGRMALVAVLLAVGGLVVSVLPWDPRIEAALATATVLAVALQGHAVSLPPVLLSAIATALHVGAAVLWAAGLLWLDHRSRAVPEGELRADVIRLSPWGMGMVVAIAVTGAILMIERVAIDQLLTSGYGRLGLVKVAALLVAVGIAWWNRRLMNLPSARTTTPGSPASPGSPRAPVGPAAPPMGQAGAVAVETSERDAAGPEPPTPVGALRRGVRAEVVALAVALIAGAALAQVPPPDMASAAGPAVTGGMFVERAEFGDGHLDLTFDPGRRGVNEVHVTALAPDGRLMSEAAEFSLAMELPSEDVGPIEPQLQVITVGHSSAFVRVPFEGDWIVTVTSRTDRFTELSARFEVPIGR